jgi:hypothetical protein
MKFDVLMAQLQAAGLQAVVLPTCSGGKIVVTPHGARVLGLFTHETAENAFWVNLELADPGSAKKMLAGEHVLGGDRVWIAPERGLFFKGNKLEDGVVTQGSIDPGNWVVGKLTEKAIRLTNDFTATYFHVPGSRVRGLVERSIRQICRPLAEKPANVAYAGYEIASRFDLLEAPQDDLHFGMWFLIQMVTPAGGYLYAPTSGRAVVTGDYFEATGPDYLKVTETHVRFKLDSLARHKIGIRKNEVLGRAGFLTNAGAGEGATLIVRNFLCNPSGHYSDVPLHTPTGTQDCIQSYNHFTGPTGFGELEYHSPGICRKMAEPVVTDVNQVWVFTGKRGDLVPVAAKLLNLPAEVFAV